MSSITDILADHHYELLWQGGVLVGPAAEFLAAEARQAQFFLIGEEHGVGSNLQFATALYKRLRAQNTTHYVTEVGPVSAAHLQHLAQKPAGEEAFSAFYAQFPFSIPFAWFKEEVALLQAAAQAGATIMGIDQEFIFSPQWHFHTLHTLTSDSRFKGYLAEWLEIEQNAFQQMSQGTPPDQLDCFMSRPLPPHFDTLYQSFITAQNQPALAVMEALKVSYEIYNHYSQQRYYANNQTRAQTMKRYFTEGYKKQPAGENFLFKLGANHVKRGHSPMGVQDIGNFVSELAVFNQTHSFHLFVLPLAGAHNVWLPFLPESYQAHPIAESYGPAFSSLTTAAPHTQGWQLYDLRPLRARHNFWSKETPELKELILGYDAVLMINPVTPAGLL